jgi:hypothetical protein
LELVYRSDSGPLSNEVRLAVPAIEGLDVRQTLWAVSSPTICSEVTVENDSLSISKPEYRAARQHAADRIRKISAELAIDQDEGNAAEWSAAADRLAEDVTNPVGTDSAKATFPIGAGQAVLPPPPALEQVIDRMKPTRPTLASIKGKGTVLRLRRELPHVTSLFSRGLLAAFIVLAAMFTVSRSPVDVEKPLPGHWILLAAGISWWIWLSPAFVALFVLATALIAAMLWGRKSHALSG